MFFVKYIKFNLTCLIMTSAFNLYERKRNDDKNEENKENE